MADTGAQCTSMALLLVPEVRGRAHFAPTPTAKSMSDTAGKARNHDRCSPIPEQKRSPMPTSLLRRTTDEALRGLWCPEPCTYARVAPRPQPLDRDPGLC